MATVKIEIPLTPKNNNEVLGGAHLRRDTTGVLGFEHNGPKILSRYLRARTESCHDFCKFGTNDRFEATQKSLALKSITSPKKLPPVANNGNRKMFIVRKPSLDFDTLVPDSPRVSNSFPSPKKILLPKHDSSLPANKGGAKATKPLTTRLSLVSSEQQTRDKKISNTSKNKKMGGRQEAKEVQASSVKFVEKALNMNDLDDENKVDETTTNEGPAIQSSSALKTSTLDEKGTSTRLAKPTASSSGSRNTRTTNKRLRHHNRTQVPSWSPHTFTRSHSKSTLTEESSTVSEQNENKSTLSSHKKGRPAKRVGIIKNLEHKKQVLPPRNLQFKERKGIALQPENNNNARRLKFRKGKVQVNGNKTKQEKVFLKHQDIEEKKECQSLFNNVIEETVGKLVKTRKSKVEALVGAFETLISLQDAKPVTVTTIC